MGADPLVSVVIPVYNGEKFIHKTLESVFAQDYKNYEALVIDDGSSDNSAKIIKTFDAAQYLFQENQGNAAARNKGILEAKGDFIALLDQDDLWTKNKLTEHIKHHLNYPEVLYTIAYLRFFLEDGVEKPVWFREELLRQKHVDHSPGSLVAHRRAFDTVGMFDPTYKLTSDSDWIFRAKDKKISMAIIPKVLLLRRIHKTNQSAQVKQAHSEFLNLIRKSVKRKKTANRNE